MTQQSPDPYRHKKIKGVFTITLAVAITLGYNAFILHQERSSGDAPERATGTETSATYTLAEVAEHASEESCWMAAYGNVYDLTSYVAMNRHPGGQAQLLSGCGQEVTEVFDRIHSSRAQNDLAQFQIGTLAE